MTIFEEGIPENFDSAVKELTDYLIQNYHFPVTKGKFDINSYASKIHHSFGMQLRNAWGLWKDNQLTQDFASRGIYHADDMSGLLITAALKHFTNEPFDFDEEAKIYWKHWIEYFPNTELGQKTKNFVAMKGVAL